jgi:superfamily II RNA helicase
MNSFAELFDHPLDDFQFAAIDSMSKNHSVFVAAHTGAGKTVLAEYAYFLSDDTKMIYTAPLKAISNQKYHDFCKKFGSNNVGIMTGDVVKNDTAKLVIMTTEIFRTLVISKDERLTSVKWVIYDEIHYMNSADRGTVWEESLILMPNTMRAVFLSATVPNAFAFAKWFGKMKHHIVDVVSTHRRPVPLSFDVIHENTIKNIGEFDKIKADEPTVITKDVVDLLKTNELTPCIVFTCNKKRIDLLANRLYKSAGFVTVYESKNIRKRFEDLLRKCTLTEDDVFHIKYIEYASKGIGVHHAGMIPYCKEIVEILFCEGLLPVLLSTETFAMGVNGPAHSVVFESLHKFDGNENRLFKEHEFVQMAGRAGRRGFDSEGRVFVLHDPMVEKGAVAKLIRGTPEPLRSSLRISSGLVLRCIQRRINVEDIINNSFDSFCAFTPTDDQRRLVKTYNEQTNLWRDIVNRPEIWKFVKKGDECALDVGIRGTFSDVAKNGSYKVLGVDGNMYTRGVVEILGLNFKKMKIKDFETACAVSKLKNISRVDRPDDYDKIMEYEQLEETNHRLLAEYRDYVEWLKSENMIHEEDLTPIGEMACGISSICPVLGTKLLDDSVDDSDIIRAISTFPAATDASSIGNRANLRFEEFCPRFVNWNLVEGVGMWFEGRDIRDICEELHIFEGALVQVMMQVRNTLLELIAVKSDDSTKLQNIYDTFYRGILKTSSLYV